MDQQEDASNAELPGPIGFVFDGRSLDDLDRELEQAGMSKAERDQALEHIRRTQAQQPDRDNRGEP